jgi:hypothetical protein
MLVETGWAVEESQYFNTHLKGVYKHIPDADRPEFMRRWLDLELWLNQLALPYDDSKARTWQTRNYILRRALVASPHKKDAPLRSAHHI